MCVFKGEGNTNIYHFIVKQIFDLKILNCYISILIIYLFFIYNYNDLNFKVSLSFLLFSSFFPFNDKYKNINIGKKY